MTEYDYSPAAYERYIAQQTRVSNWVSDTLQQAHAYSNPFVLSPTLRDRSFYDQAADAADDYPRHHDQWSSSSRPSRTRSRSYVDHAHHDRTPPSRHRTQSHTRTSSRDVYPQFYSQPQVVSHTPAPRRHTDPPHSYPYAPARPAHSPTRQPYVTQPPPGQIYHISPNGPAPVPKDTPYRHASHTRHSSSKPPPQPYLLVQGGGPKAEYKHGPPIHAPIPIKPHGQQPLLKRLFGFVTNSPVGGRSGNGRGVRGSSY